jgi:hypothetical protein
MLRAGKDKGFSLEVGRCGAKWILARDTSKLCKEGTGRNSSIKIKNLMKRNICLGVTGEGRLGSPAGAGNDEAGKILIGKGKSPHGVHIVLVLLLVCPAK